MLLIDTSVWINVFRDSSGKIRNQLQALIADQEVVLTHFNQLELLQGCRDEQEWSLLQSYLHSQDYMEMTPDSWKSATFFPIDELNSLLLPDFIYAVSQLFA
jgi:predicted nucleic acid-binding protein